MAGFKASSGSGGLKPSVQQGFSSFESGAGGFGTLPAGTNAFGTLQSSLAALTSGPVQSYSILGVVRPAVYIESHLKDRSPGPLEIPEQVSEIRWGKASSFQWSVTNPPSTNGGGSVSFPDGDDEEAELGPKTLEFDETARTVENIRVENPSDSAQYVIVQRINEITFRGPSDFANALIQLRDGTISELLFKYILHHPVN